MSAACFNSLRADIGEHLGQFFNLQLLRLAD